VPDSIIYYCVKSDGGSSIAYYFTMVEKEPIKLKIGNKKLFFQLSAREYGLK
jgi:hypothetical protein